MRALRTALWCVATPLVLVTAGAGAAWLWSDTDTSLATSLALAQRALPAGQTLEASGVTGSVRQGGRMERLRWEGAGLRIDARDVELTWSWRALLDGAWQVNSLSIAKLNIDDQRPPTAGPASPPPDDLSLPVRVDAKFAVGELHLTGNTELVASAIAGNYVFDSKQHRVIGGSGRISSGSYRFAADLQATAPQRLTAQLDGTVQTALPGRKEPIEVVAHASVVGALAGQNASLDVQASLIPPTAQAMQAQATARIQPWSVQPLVQAQAQWQSLDLATLWPQAPRTRLSGQAAVTPDGDGWKSTVEASNALPGPWDQQRLPLEKLNASLAFNKNLWSLESLQARGAQGRVDAQAQAKADNLATGWLGLATVTGINPAALHSQLAAASISGSLRAEPADGGIRFKVKLADTKGGGTNQANANALLLKNVEAQGLWKAPLLQLDTLVVQTRDAQLNGTLGLNTKDLSTRGDWTLQLPGAKGSARFQMAKTQGDGELQLQTTDAGLTHRWLTQLPGAPRDLAAAKVAGEATLKARWTGGWQDQGKAISVTASVQVPRLDWAEAGAPDSATWRLRDAQVDVSGTPAAMVLTTQAKAENNTQRLRLEAKAQGGRGAGGSWSAQIDSTRLTVQDTRRPGVWTAQLADPVAVLWKQTAATQTLEGSAGNLLLTGPVPGAASVAWQAARWTQTAVGGQLRSQWNTRGRITDLPMAWLEHFSPTQWSQMGLKGDVVLGGEWEATSADSLRVRARVERTSGDLQVRPDEDSPSVQAGLQQARLEINTVDDKITASLRWDSERAGQAQADFSTRLQRQDSGWVWPQDAPLAGRFKAKLPPVGAWSVLAPPGWRLRGTLDADASLTGTRGRPQWSGQLGAQGLALRSVVDGIDFSKGTLRTKLEGERLEIEEISFQGAGGASGGTLTAQGFVQWQTDAAAGAEGNGLSKLQINLNAIAKSLRVSARSDQRLVVSGKISTQLQSNKLVIRGNLKADQALFVMPEDTTPRLGNDVVVRKPPAGNAATATTTPATAKPAAAANTRIQPDLQVTLDLGKDFQVRGAGLVTLLEGSLELRNVDQSLQPRLTGILRTAQGTYKAYGQQLDIEEGVLRFTGPYDNPSLDILAIRPNMTQRVGVQISGTAQLPIVRLYAEPDLPESEKLAWLILGRSGANGGAETALLQQAALALLGGRRAGGSGNLANTFGLDEVSVRASGDSTNGSAGTANGASGATVTLGKRLSRDFYVAYERSLANTVGSLSIFYDLSRRFTLRAQTGEQSAVDLIFTLRYD